MHMEPFNQPIFPYLGPHGHHWGVCQRKTKLQRGVVKAAPPVKQSSCS